MDQLGSKEPHIGLCGSGRGSGFSIIVCRHLYFPLGPDPPPGLPSRCSIPPTTTLLQQASLLTIIDIHGSDLPWHVILLVLRQSTDWCWSQHRCICLTTCSAFHNTWSWCWGSVQMVSLIGLCCLTKIGLEKQYCNSKHIKIIISTFPNVLSMLYINTDVTLSWSYVILYTSSLQPFVVHGPVH